MEKIIEKLDELEISDLSKSRVLYAIETMAEGKRFYIIKTDEFKEYAVLINNNIVIKTKKYDYAGSVAIRKETPVGLRDFVEYLDTRAKDVEETQERIRTM